MTGPYQLLFVDLLYLCTAVGIGLWFRAWLRRQQRAMDERLASLEAQQAQLARLGERLQGVCRGLEGVFARAAREAESPRGTASFAGPASGAGRGRRPSDGHGRSDLYRPSAAAPEGAARGAEEGRAGGRRDDPYGRARELLGQGVAPAEVARCVGLGIAEVNVLRRMQS